ncbi:hypothetical protein J2S00_002710 [Caldalkalibacillus uzonensis]|uniref:Uncharacterized protein n=1 Tax=Caldalkalibacillus uzonensis TaxID=353224 RepID=A0ABU0CWM4_9BACI|nr:hypothetical protein [Caldalkalibacillus uzonensis]
MKTKDLLELVELGLFKEIKRAKSMFLYEGMKG